MWKEMVHTRGSKPNTQKDARERLREAPGDTELLVPVPEGPEAALIPGFLMPRSFSSLILQ